MKKIATLVLILSFSCISFIYADEVRTIEKNVPTSGGRFLLLDDNSYWVIYPVAKKSRSLFQWIRRKQIPQPEENFLFAHEDWRPGTMITVQEHFWNKDNQMEMDKYHQPKVAVCPFLLGNYTNTQVAFARNISLSEAIDLFSQFAEQCYNEGKKNGYSKGYHRGYSSGYSNGYIINDIVNDYHRDKRY